MIRSHNHVYSLVVVCHGNFQHQCQEIQLGAGSLTEARFWMHSSGSTAGFLYKATIQKSKKIIRNLNFTHCMILIFNFTYCTLYLFQKEVVTAVVVSVGCVTRPILALECPVSTADSAGLRACRIDFQQHIRSNIVNLPTSIFCLIIFV